MNVRALAEARPDLLTEAQLSGLVVEIARLGGWKLRYHTFTSRRSAHGFPDWVFVHPARQRILFAELKSEKGKLTGEQQEWIAGLELIPGVEVHVWRPSDWPSIVETLTGRRPVNKIRPGREEAA